MIKEYFPGAEIHQESFDNELFQKLRRIKAPLIIESLNGEKEQRGETRAFFLAGKVENPTLEYPYINVTKCQQAIDKLKKLLLEIDDIDDITIAEAYRKHIKEQITGQRILIATSEGNNEMFMECSEQLYGKPDAQRFSDVITRIRRGTLAKGINHDNPDIGDYAIKLDAELPEGGHEISIQAPSKDLIKKYQFFVESSKCVLDNVVKEKIMYDPESVCDAFNMSLVRIGADGWQAVVDRSTGRTAMSVNAKMKIINIPEKQYSGKTIQKFDAHEIATHVQRRVNGHKSGLRILGRGLDKYDNGEEGLATLMEQLLAGEVPDYSRSERYLAIGLAAGTDGSPRNFRQVFEILKKYKLLRKMISQNKYLEDDINVTNSTWSICVRSFRGTDCATPGACFTKDIIYRDGNVNVWEFLKTADKKQIAMLMDGKFDPARQDHWEVVIHAHNLKKNIAT